MVQIARSTAAGVGDVARELAAAFEPCCDPAADPGIVLCFAARRYAGGALAEALAEALPAPVYGCTTAGEIGPGGFAQGSVVAMWLRSPGLRFGAHLIERCSASDFAAGREAIARAAARVGTRLEELDARSHFLLMLADGMANCEETLAASIAAAAPEVAFVGGSAADGLDFRETWIFADGKAHRDAALLILVRSTHPFALIKTEHMEPTETRVVVTRAEPERRLVLELNGRPARAEYGRLLGVSAEEVTTALASTAPFACYVAGVPYVRSVGAVEGDTLKFACAVAEGVVLRLMRPGDLVASTARALETAVARVGGKARGIVAFHCLGRYLEAETRGLTTPLAQVFDRYPLAGFNTYGEQCNGLHINHTLTGMVIGE